MCRLNFVMHVCIWWWRARDRENPYENLNSKTILITGGASGIGATMFKAWAKHNATIIIGDINEIAGSALVESTRKETNNPNLYFLKLDVVDWKSQTSFFKQASKLSPHGGIDCVIANAGIADLQENQAFENPPDYLNLDDPPPPGLRTLNINLTGVMYTTTLTLSYLSHNPSSSKCNPSTSSSPRDRHLLLISSIAGLFPIPTQSIYCTSKHGVVGLFRALRTIAPQVHGVRINMLNPYFVNTPILGSLGGLVLAGGGMADIDEVVDAATRFVTDQSIIGRALAVGTVASREEAESVGLTLTEAKKRQAAWDVYAHDFEQSDLFTRRVVALTNLRADERGLQGLLADVGWALTAPARRLFGY